MHDSPLLIGITGISGAGKTFYLDRLKEYFGNRLSSLSFDDYYRPFSEQSTDANGMINFDLPDSLKHEDFARDLRLLMSGNTVMVKKYHFENFELPEEFIAVEPAEIMIIEGLFVFYHEHINSMIHRRIFVETDLEVSFTRRLRRDLEERGIPEDRSVYQWKNHVMDAWRKYILPHRDASDMIIENSSEADYNLKLLTEKIEEWLLAKGSGGN